MNERLYRPPRFCFPTYCSPDKPIMVILDWMASNNLRYVDIGQPHFSLAQAPSEWRRLSTACRAKRIEPYIFTVNDENLWLHLESCDPQLDMEGMSILLKAANSAGVQRIGIVARTIPPKILPQEAINRLASTYARLREECESTNVSLLTEIHLRGPIRSIRDAELLWVMSKSPFVGFILDTSMLNLLGISFSEACSRFASSPLIVHVRDVVNGDMFGIPGRGRLDFLQILEDLNRIGYDGALIIELFRTIANYGMPIEEATLDARAFLLDQWRRLHAG